MFELIYSGPQGGFTVKRDGVYIASGQTIEEALENAYFHLGCKRLVINCALEQ